MGGAWGIIVRRAAFALWLAFGIHGAARAEDCLTLGAPSGAGATDEIMTVVREAGKRAKVCVQTLRAPKNRLPALALDGEILTDSKDSETDGLTALPTPVATFEGGLYWLPTRPEPSGPHLRIGVILGHDWALRAVAERGSQAYEVRDNRQLMEMMAAGRLDGMMLPSISFRHFLPGFPGLRDCQSKMVTPLPVRVLLKSGHRAAAAALDRALAAMRRDGTTEAIFRRYAP